MLLVTAVVAAARLLAPPAEWSGSGEALQRCLSWLGPRLTLLTSQPAGHTAWALRALHHGEQAAVSLRSLPQQLSPLDRLQETQIGGSRAYFSSEEAAYLVVGSNIELLRQQLGHDGPPFNPRARYLLIMELEEAAPLLEALWEGRRALFALGLWGGRACRYDAFAVDADSRYGAVICFTVDRTTDLAGVFSRSLRDLNGYVLPVGIMVWDPYSYDWDNTTQTGLGRDLLTLSQLSRSLNFRPAMHLLSSFGIREPTGVVTGALAATANAELELFINGRLVKWLGGGVELVSPPVNGGQVLVVVPRAAPLPLWQALVGALSGHVWLAAAVCYATAVATVRLAAAITGDRPVVGAAGPLLSLAGAPWTGVTAAGRRLPTAVLVGGFLLAGLTLSAVLQGAAFTAVAAPARRHQIDSPEELDASGLRVCPPSPGVADVFDNRDGPAWRSLGSKVRQCAMERGWDTGGFTLEPDTAWLLGSYQWRRRSPIFDEVRHVMKGFSWNYMQAYSVPRGSVFLEAFSRLTAQVVESGLANKWLDDRLDVVSQRHLKLGAAEKQLANRWRQQLGPLTLSQMGAAAFVLAAGYLLSVVVFLLELACKKFMMNHPQ